MKLAIWGIGKRGRRLLDFLLDYGIPEYEVKCIIDRDKHALGEYRFPSDLLKITPDQIRQQYEKRCFDAVIISVAEKNDRKEMTGQLNSARIPVVTEQEIEQMILTFKLRIQESQLAIFQERSLNFPETLINPDLIEPYKKELNLIEAHISDQESRELLRSRCYFSLTGQEQPFLYTMWKYWVGREYRMWDLFPPMKACGARRVILFGEGKDCILNYNALEMCSMPVAALCIPDGSDPTELGFTKKRIITAEDLLEPEFCDCLVVISSQKQRNMIRDTLNDMHFPKERIYDPPSVYTPILTGGRLAQYFDVWKARPHEVFVDCGAFDGQTLMAFHKWAKEYDAVFALEPLPDMRQIIMKNTNNLHNLTLFSVAVWDKNEELVFEIGDEMPGSCVSSRDRDSKKCITVQGKALDSLISTRISFLKMDIEGSEMEALNGAAELIRKWKPRLAISVYHKPEDILEIPMRILELVPEYQFRIRHYGAGPYETVLYATVEDGVWLDC